MLNSCNSIKKEFNRPLIYDIFYEWKKLLKFKEKKKNKYRPVCPSTGKRGGGVLLVTEYDHNEVLEPCLVVFKHKKRLWECPMGKYDGPPYHNTVVDTACSELYEETSCLIKISSHLLLEKGVRGGSDLIVGGRALHDGWFALRVDGLSRSHYEINLKSIENHKDKKKLRCFREMKDIRFIPLRELRGPLESCTASLDDLNKEKKIIIVKDIDGKETKLGKLARKLMGNKEDLGGLDMVECAFIKGPCKTILEKDPIVKKKKIIGATTFVVIP